MLWAVFTLIAAAAHQAADHAAWTCRHWPRRDRSWVADLGAL